MTLDDLDKLFEEAATPKSFVGQVDYRKGVAAVVRALRDHFCAPVHVQHHFNWAMHDLRFAFDQILGSDAGNEKVAGACADGTVVQRQRYGENDRQSKDGAEVSPRHPDPATDYSRKQCADCDWPSLPECRKCGYPFASTPATDPIRNAVAMARGRTLAVDDIPTLNKLAAMMSPATDFAAPANRKHPSHKTRISFDASSYDEICVRCGATDRIGSWGRLAEPCSNPAPAERSDATAVCEWTQKKDAPGFCSTPHGIAYRGVPFPECPSCGLPIKFTEAK